MIIRLNIKIKIKIIIFRLVSNFESILIIY